MRLVKIDPTKNMRKFYEIDIQQNLFGGFSVIRNWGRIGAKGQVKIELHDDRTMAQCSREKLRTIKLKRGYKVAI
jgi:predicted DNA-binding WGR domain protein